MESEDDTIEFEIEVVTSSSSISLASNSISDSKQPEDDFAKDAKHDPQVETTNTLHRVGGRSEVTDDEIANESTTRIQIDSECEQDSTIQDAGSIELPPGAGTLAQDGTEIPELQFVGDALKSENTIISTQLMNDTRQVIQDNELIISPHAEIDNLERSCAVDSDASQSKGTKQEESLDIDQIPKAQYEIELQHSSDNTLDASQVEPIEDLSNVLIGSVQRSPNGVDQKFDGAPDEIELTLEQVDEGTNYSTDESKTCHVQDLNLPIIDVKAIDYVIIRDTANFIESRGEITSVIKQIAIQTAELERLVSEEHATRVEVLPEHDIVIEPREIETETDAEQQSPEQEIQVVVTSIDDGDTTRLLPVAKEIIDDDLEREFDEEPKFERRDVILKRGLDPRAEYELSDELGRGRFGTVFRCVEQSSGRKLAAKFVNMRRKEDREDVEREISIMCKLQHKRLLQLYDAFDNGKTEMCLITELVEGGELFERIIDDDFELTEKKAAIFMRQICEGVHYMHSQHIVHLDMKPENILCISKTGNRIKLIDFGLARHLSSTEPLRVMFGTPDFAAPEVLAYDIVSLATDMWSVGVICYVLLSGLSPFMGDNDIETMANVTRATYDFDDSAFDPISDLAKDFISKLLVKDPSQRLTPEQCLRHSWLQRGGAQLEASVRERRESSVVLSNMDAMRLAAIASAAANGEDIGDSLTSTPVLVSLDKRNLKKYVVRRKWHKTVHAIMALGRMGANLKSKLSAADNHSR